MVDNAELIKLFDTELDILINKAHRSLWYWQILGEMLKKCDILYGQAEIEYKIKGGK